MKKSSGSMKADYQKYLQSAHWQQRRKKAIEDTGHICEKCDLPRWLAQIAYQQDLNVHHLNYANLGHEEDCDLEVLCRRCHDIESFGRSDFRAPKKSACDACGCVHWDLYGGLCEVCRSIIGKGDPLEFRLSSCDPEDGESIWKIVLRRTFWWLYMRKVPTEDILGLMIEAHRNFNNFQKQAEENKDCPF